MNKMNLKIEDWTQNHHLIQWVQDMAQLCQPKDIHLCDGSEKEYNQIAEELVAKKKAIRLNPKKRPNSYYFHSHPDDVARVEESTFICSKSQEDAGPTNNWKNPDEMKKHLLTLFQGCMQGRTMYVIPFSMGPIGSDKSHIGVQISDSGYVVMNMKLMTRMGAQVLKELRNGFFIPCMHSVGVPLKEGVEDSLWPCNPEKRIIVHFPEERNIWSFGSGYGGNALLGKKCFALRIASVLARDNGWLAEHMLILKITNPKNESKYFAAAFPSACGKTNLALLQSHFKDWKIECVGDDIAWMKFGSDGRLYAINPEAGMFGVAPGISMKTTPNALRTIEKNTIFTNVALTADHDVWWEGLTDTPPSQLTDWKGNAFDPNSKSTAAHPNARFTVSISQCPIVDPAYDDPEGVPISAIIFGGRRESTVPLVFESFNWEHGTFLGTSVSSEMTAAQKGKVGKLRHDPFAMLPFCGYNMGNYFSHWIHIGRSADPEKLPRIFYANWFQKDEKGSFIWPGFQENIRVLQWIFERLDGKDNCVKTPIGNLPEIDSLNTEGLDLTKEELQKLLEVDLGQWLEETQELEEYYKKFEPKLPKEIKEELESLKARLQKLCVS